MGLRSEDAERLQAAGSKAVDYASVNPYCFEPPIAPELAAAQAGVEIQQDVIERSFRELAARSDWVIVEGVGGWRVPLAPGREMTVTFQSRAPLSLEQFKQRLQIRSVFDAF